MPHEQTIGDMTLEELEALVHEIIKREMALHRQPETVEEPERTIDEIFASIDQNRIVLPSGARSSLDLLREDRDR